MTRPAITASPSLEDALRYCEEAGGRRPSAAHPDCTCGKARCGNRRCKAVARPDNDGRCPRCRVISRRGWSAAPKCPLEHP